ncbi:helix-turn-helix domain-containing protein [Mobilitalea sibirica]|nr:AraC family transcriptional regulator [Mobilitalea sibirica]
MRITNVSQINELFGNEQLKHPLITLLRPNEAKIVPEIKEKICVDLYSISLKDGSECKIKYGRKMYDFQGGTLICLAPGQIIEPISRAEIKEFEGWNLIFHPDLIRSTNLGAKINDYSFFYYESYEALHISDHEKEVISGVVDSICAEYQQNIDIYTQDVLVSNIELLLNYCKRFYGRQMLTRKHESQDIVQRFEKLLKSYFDSDEPKNFGLPSVRYCSEQLGYSANYLSDVLKQETGKNAQEQIHFYLIEKAKDMLLGTSEPVNTIAYELGFKYPQHLSVLFKKKIGVSPNEFRK